MPDLTWFEFVETSIFTKRFGNVGLHDSLVELQADLLESPTRWPVIAGLKGARKGRLSDRSHRRGRRGSFRYIYLYLPHVSRIYLLFVFEKNELDNLSKEQQEVIADLCVAIRRECAKYECKESELGKVTATHER